MNSHIGPLRFGKWDLSDRKVREGRGLGFALGRLIWLVVVAAALILVLGIALTWGNANQHNELVHAVMRAGQWLATPFQGVFHDPNARERLTENWFLAAAAYLVGGGILSWLFDR